MKISKLFGSALLAISLCFTACDEIRTQAGVNTDIDGDGIIDGTNPSNPSNPSTPSIRPLKIDMTGVQGFAIVENTSNAPRTKADMNGDGVDDDMPNGNGDEAVNTSPYALYSIDENGELHASIFYFEVVPSEDGSTDVSNAEVLKEISDALQIVPSLVSDLGKYILFSGCQYQIISSDISDEALSICQAYISENARWDMTYMIRKSDGGLFDFSSQGYFTYYHYWDDGKYFIRNTAVEYNIHEKLIGWHIAANDYIISTKGNLFTSNRSFIAKFEDNDVTVDVEQMTQNYGQDNLPAIERFIVDKDENIYLFNRANGRRGAMMDIYYANGGFNAYEFEPSLSNIENYDPFALDLITDESGDLYLFLISNSNRKVEKVNAGDGSTYYDYDSGQLVLSARLNNGVVEPLNETFIQTNKGYDYYNHDNTENHYYLGYYNNCFNWCLRFLDDYDSTPHKILSYDINTQTCTLTDASTELNHILLADYDAVTYGNKTYCANVKETSIEVTEVDLASETSRSYSLSVDMPFIVSPTFVAYMIQDIPYLRIDGRNTTNGAEVSITVNLINGENNSTFASDARNVVSFFRIN